jgi:hypothetical protein
MVQDPGIVVLIMEMKLEAQGVMQVQGPQEVLHPEEIMEAIDSSNNSSNNGPPGGGDSNMTYTAPTGATIDPGFQRALTEMPIITKLSMEIQILDKCS